MELIGNVVIEGLYCSDIPVYIGLSLYGRGYKESAELLQTRKERTDDKRVRPIEMLKITYIEDSFHIDTLPSMLHSQPRMQDGRQS